MVFGPRAAEKAADRMVRQPCDQWTRWTAPRWPWPCCNYSLALVMDAGRKQAVGLVTEEDLVGPLLAAGAGR